MLIHAVIIIELHQEFGGIHLIDPGRHILHRIIRTFPGHGVHQHNPAHRFSAEQADVEFFHRADPVRHAVVIDLEEKLVSENIGRKTEPDMPVQIPVKVFRLGIFDALLQHDALRILSGHVDADVSGNSVSLVGQPFDGTGIDQRRDTYRNIVIIDLSVIVRHLELGNHIHQASHLPVSQKSRRILIQKRNGTIVRLLNILSKIPGLHGHKLLVLLRIDDRRRQQRSDSIDDKQQQEQDPQPFDGRIVLQGKVHGCHPECEDFLSCLPEHIDHHHDSNGSQQKKPEAAGMDIDGRKRDVIVNECRYQSGHADNRIQDTLFHFLLLFCRLLPAMVLGFLYRISAFRPIIS